MVIINLVNSINDTLTDIVNDIKKYIDNVQEKVTEIELNIKSKDKNPKLIIDRFEGQIAVCENLNDASIVNVKKEKLPLNIKEGQVVNFDGNKYVIDFKTTSLLKKDIKEITKDLWEN